MQICILVASSLPSNVHSAAARVLRAMASRTAALKFPSGTGARARATRIAKSRPLPKTGRSSTGGG
eukprot:4526888-Pyramimonas_sp.AAC.1